ncbi:mitochondrial 37S ribosomal protein rsm10 [Vermiconidia calcicola]|uniref:Mitochondrial 37S ribosomal protein rsm10 n=1 Tax=Vermiconidia calcicola TaxID=1690605 RepID=A0ACC3NFK7_9PEZI|nr:mitochondrial 37S ribosomal protein rsm10 [Vermiconidia calcicola]
MATPSYTRSLVCAAKRLKISPPNPSPQCLHQTRNLQQQSLPPQIQTELSQIRLPRAVQATYLAPLKRQPTHNIPTCDLQLRSYSVRNLEVFADFALRAAYFLHLPASGPVPLPKITERWTVPRSTFVHKKSQENFERITLRRLVQIKDGHPETVSVWLAFLRKYQYFGVGMKANVYEFSGLGVGADLDREAEGIGERLGEKMELFGTREHEAGSVKGLEEMVHGLPFKGQWGAMAPMSANGSVPVASERMGVEVVGEEGR